jgi:hypothetical protein
MGIIEMADYDARKSFTTIKFGGFARLISTIPFLLLAVISIQCNSYLITHNEQPPFQAVYIGNTGISMRVTP